MRKDTEGKSEEVTAGATGDFLRETRFTKRRKRG
jgi:hypothetical protein